MGIILSSSIFLVIDSKKGMISVIPNTAAFEINEGTIVIDGETRIFIEAESEEKINFASDYDKNK